MISVFKTAGPRLKLLGAVLPLVLLLAVLPVVLFAPAAEAQEVICEKVTYNERIVTKCSSSGTSDDRDPGSGTPDSSSNDDDDDDDGDGATTSRGDDDDDERRVDRGSRGGRIGVDADFDDDDGGDRSDGSSADSGSDEDDGDGAAFGDDEDRPATSRDGDGDDDSDDDATSDDGGDTDSGDSDDGGDNDSDSEEVAAGFDGTTDSSPSNLPIALGVAGLAVVGSGLFLAARRNRRKAELDVPADSDDSSPPSQAGELL